MYETNSDTTKYAAFKVCKKLGLISERLFSRVFRTFAVALRSCSTILFIAARQSRMTFLTKYYAES